MKLHSIVRFYSISSTHMPHNHRERTVQLWLAGRQTERNGFLFIFTEIFLWIALPFFHFAYLFSCVFVSFPALRLVPFLSTLYIAVRPLSRALATGTNRNFSGRWRASKAQQVELQAVSQKNIWELRGEEGKRESYIYLRDKGDSAVRILRRE